MKLLFTAFACLLVLNSVKSQTAYHAAPRPERYIGDLAVSLRYHSIVYDTCTASFKLYIDIITGNLRGNMPFSYNIHILKDGRPAEFYLNNGTHETVITISNLEVGGKKIVPGYVLCSTLKNLEGPDAVIVASIGSIQLLDVIRDNVPANNRSSYNAEFPYIRTVVSPFDHMNVIDMPATADLQGTRLNNIIIDYLPNKMSWKDCGDAVGLGTDNNIIEFEKVGCVAKGKPIYNMKKGNKYYFLDAAAVHTVTVNHRPAGNLFRWVFVQTTNGFYIYNLTLGTFQRLDVLPPTADCQMDLLYARPPNNRENQVFFFRQ
jgi:hypothetical protein